jgi:hypothetical protein
MSEAIACARRLYVVLPSNRVVDPKRIIGKRLVPVLLLLGTPIFTIILFVLTILLTRMTGISLHLQWPLTKKGVFFVVAKLDLRCRVARYYIFKPEIPIWVNLGGSFNGRC